MTKREHHYPALIAVLLLAGAEMVASGAGRRPPETDLAAPGAPLYESALTESVRSLMSKQEQAALEVQGRPPSPGPDYFWCENCKTYHKRQAPAAAQQPAAAQSPGAAPAISPQSATIPAARPPSPGPDYYWCEHCKTYHRRQTQPHAPGLFSGPATNRLPQSVLHP